MSTDVRLDTLPEAAAEGDDELEASDTAIDQGHEESQANVPRRGGAERRFAFVVLPATVLALGALAGYLSWQSSHHRAATIAATDSVAAAREAAVAILSYKPDTVDKDLNAARDRLTGSFLLEYTKLVNDVVIPGSKEKKISSVTRVPAAASVSATPDHAVALVFIDQTVTMGKDTPTNTASSIKVTLDKVERRWLVSGFEPV